MDTELVQFGIEYRMCRKKIDSSFCSRSTVICGDIGHIRLFQLPSCCQRAVMNDEFFIPFWPSTLRYRHLRERD